jgi:hypothetical protein
MKLSIAVIATTLAVSQAFMVAPSTRSSTQLNAASLDRREFFTNAAALAATAALVGAPQMAFAADYVPSLDNMKQIYFLGASLDKLVAKLENPDTVEAALEGVRLFNKDPDFYTGYARNFILKEIKKGTDQDPRVGYIKQVRNVFFRRKHTQLHMNEVFHGG